jgi:hypothetical protein
MAARIGTLQVDTVDGVRDATRPDSASPRGRRKCVARVVRKHLPEATVARPNKLTWLALAHGTTGQGVARVRVLNLSLHAARVQSALATARPTALLSARGGRIVHLIHVAAGHVADEALVRSCASRMASADLSYEVARRAAQTLCLGPRLQLLMNSQLLIVLALTRLVGGGDLLLAQLLE